MTTPGRPRLYDDPIYFEERVEAYFDECEKTKEPPSLAGISYFLGFSDKESFGRYGDYEGFSRTVKRARLRMEADKNKRLHSREFATAGVIFDLKNNHGWSDQIRHGEMTPNDFAEEARRAMREMDKVTASSDESDA